MTFPNFKGISIRLDLLSLVVFSLAIIDLPDDTQGVFVRIAALLFALFLHEFAHWKMASYRRLKVSEILLSPIGGQWRYTSAGREKIVGLVPETASASDAIQESDLAMAAAGPLANLAASAFFWLLLMFIKSSGMIYLGDLNLLQMVRALMNLNLIIGAINLFPAPPFDGVLILDYLVLRESKSAQESLPGGSRISAAPKKSSLKESKGGLVGIWKELFPFERNTIHQWSALVIVLSGAFSDLLILNAAGVIVLIWSYREKMTSHAISLFSRVPLTDVMRSSNRVDTIRHGMTIYQALTSVVTSPQDFFPILHGDKAIGTVERRQLFQAFLAGRGNRSVAEVADRTATQAKSDSMLISVLSPQSLRLAKPILVVDEGKFMGVIFAKRLLELLVLNSKIPEEELVEDELF